MTATETKCSDVRVAIPVDAPAIFDLMMLAHDEAGEHVVCPEKVVARIWEAVNRNGSLIGVVGDPGKALCGYVFMVLDEVWYSTNMQILELSNFVHPDHRRSNYAKQLIAFSKKCADGLGLDLTMGVMSNARTEAKCRLYQRQLTPVGQFFVYKPNRSA